MMKSVMRIIHLSGCVVGLTGCALDPISQQDHWESSNTPDKNIQAMLVDHNDWHRGRHDADAMAPLAVEAIEHFRKIRFPLFQKTISASSRLEADFFNLSRLLEGSHMLQNSRRVRDVSPESDGDVFEDKDRKEFLGYVTDEASAEIIRESFKSFIEQPSDVRRGHLTAAVKTLESMASPRFILVDVSDQESPLELLTMLSNVVEPDVQVLAIAKTGISTFTESSSSRSGSLNTYTSRSQLTSSIACFCQFLRRRNKRIPYLKMHL